MKGKKDGKESEAAWKGEERKARSYVFVRKGEEPKPGAPKVKVQGKRGKQEESSDDDEGEGIFSEAEDEEMEENDEEDLDDNEGEESDSG